MGGPPFQLFSCEGGTRDNQHLRVVLPTFAPRRKTWDGISKQLNRPGISRGDVQAACCLARSVRGTTINNQCLHATSFSIYETWPLREPICRYTLCVFLKRTKPCARCVFLGDLCAEKPGCV